MPKETFKDWKTGERTLFELRWAKKNDVSPGQLVMYFPPPPRETPDGVFEMIGNDGDVTEIDRLIAALKRAKRSLTGEDTTSGPRPKFDLEQRVVALRTGWGGGEDVGQVVEDRVYRINRRNFRASDNTFLYGVEGENGLFAEDLFRAE